MCVRYICVKGLGHFDEKTSHRPLGEKLWYEFMTARLQFMSLVLPPAKGTIQSLLSGRIRRPFLHCTKTIHFPSGETLGNELLIPLFEAPLIGSGLPPLPPLKGIR